MIEAALRRWAVREVEAETGRVAVDFYRSCGFRAVSLGEIYPGVERFRCIFEGSSEP